MFGQWQEEVSLQVSWMLALIYGFVYVVVIPFDLLLRLTTRISLLGALRISQTRPHLVLAFLLGTISSAVLFFYPQLTLLAPRLLEVPSVLEPIQAEPVGLILSLAGALLVSSAIVKLIHSYVIRQDKGSELITTGAYGIVRNPVYVGMTLIFLGVFFMRPNLLYLLGLAMYLWLNHIRIRREERFLADLFGRQFRAYRQTAGRYRPRFRADKEAQTR